VPVSPDSLSDGAPLWRFNPWEDALGNKGTSVGLDIIGNAALPTLDQPPTLSEKR